MASIFKHFRRIADTRLGRRAASDAPAGPHEGEPSAAEPEAAEVAALRNALRRVQDPELGLDIVSLGLVHAIERDGERARVELLVTTPACPLGEQIQREAEQAIRADIPELLDVKVVLRRDLPWHRERMDAAARRQMGW